MKRSWSFLLRYKVLSTHTLAFNVLCQSNPNCELGLVCVIVLEIAQILIEMMLSSHVSGGVQVRKRKELEIMGREQFGTESVSGDVNEEEKTYPFWRKKEFKLRELTRRIMELSKRHQLDLVIFLAFWIARGSAEYARE